MSSAVELRQTTAAAVIITFFLAVGLSRAYHSAVSSLRGVMRGETQVRAQEEQSSLFNWKGRKSSAASATSWKHSFVCLSSTAADRVPTSQSGKLVLEEAGLGERTVTVPDIDCSPECFRRLLLEVFPKLQGGGGGSNFCAADPSPGNWCWWEQGLAPQGY